MVLLCSVIYFVCLCVLCSMLPVSVVRPFVTPSIFSDVYWILFTYTCTYFHKVRKILDI